MGHRVALVSPRRSEVRVAARRGRSPLDLGCRRQGGRVWIRVAWSRSQGGLGGVPGARRRSWARRSRDALVNSEMRSLGQGMLIFPAGVVLGWGRTECRSLDMVALVIRYVRRAGFRG